MGSDGMGRHLVDRTMDDHEMNDREMDDHETEDRGTEDRGTEAKRKTARVFPTQHGGTIARDGRARHWVGRNGRPQETEDRKGLPSWLPFRGHPSWWSSIMRRSSNRTVVRFAVVRP